MKAKHAQKGVVCTKKFNLKHPRLSLKTEKPDGSKPGNVFTLADVQK